MTAFLAAAAVLTAAALAFVLWPLLRTRAAQRISLRQANLSVYRDQFAELERDLELGTLDASQYESARAELERQVLEEVGDRAAAAAPLAPANSARWAAGAIAVILPVCAALLYWYLGEPRGLDPAKRLAARAQPDMTAEQFEALTQKLADRMAANPDDATGWLMLGRAYKVLERFPDAAKALAEAEKRKPQDPDVLVEYAEALALASNQNLEGEPRRLLERALKLSPDNAKALTLLGTAAFARQDYPAAIGYWERLQRQAPPDSELGQALARGIEQARSLAGGKAEGKTAQGGAAHPEAVRGEVRMAPALKERARADDTVFVFVRAADGPRMPLAVLTRKVHELPAKFQLDDSLAMASGLKVSRFPRLIVAARVSKSGSAQPQAGDLQGASGVVKPGASGVVVTIDSVVQ
jgi:cytochrome c-type biogenesis protein CcmH